MFLLLLVTCLNALLLYERFNHKEAVPQPQPQPEPIAPEPQPEPVEPEPKPQPPKPKEPEFVSVTKHRPNEDDGSVLGDVLSHSKGRPFGNAHGRATNAHETTHGINSEIRNAQPNSSRLNAFYCLEGRGCVVEEPNTHIRDCHKFLPENLRSYRYTLYLTGRQLADWGDRPLYICDEWVAYINGAETNVDDVKNNRYKGGWTDGVSGCLGFSIYTVAIAMSVHEKDPDYWNRNQQFKDFVLWNLKRAQRTYMVGHQMKEFAWEKQDKLLNEFLHSKEAEPMRQFIKTHFEGVWLDSRVMTPYFYRSPDEQIRLTPGCPHCLLLRHRH